MTETAAPSMDIQVSSNFERLLFDLHDRSGVDTAAAMHGFEAARRMTLTPEQQAVAGTLLTSRRIDPDEMAQALRWAYAECGELIDPHTAIGLAAARDVVDSIDGPVVTLATAHPAKFRSAVERASGVRPVLPQRLAGLFDRSERFDTLPAALSQIETYIAARATPR